MDTCQPKVSVVIPAYNQAEFLDKAIHSVLDQTYSNFEVIVINDASSDNTSEVVSKFNSTKIKLVVHPRNKGLPAARNSGIRNSTGEIIAFLDADDLFHPEKLQIHVNYLKQKPEVGVTYNPRFNLNHSSETIRDLWRPPLVVGLRDFVLGFPFTPSDMVVRKEWLTNVGLFDEQYIFGGEDTDLPCRLALAGCQFASVDRALTYRRYHSGRRRKNLPRRLEDVNRALTTTFNDPRCPQEVFALRSTALKHHLMVLAFLALSYEETNLGQEYVARVVQMDPTVLLGRECELLQFLLLQSIADEKIDHADLLRKCFSQLQPEVVDFSEKYDWAVTQGHLLIGARSIIWGRLNSGEHHLSRACQLKVVLDKPFLNNLGYQLASYAIEFGNTATQEVIRNLTPDLVKIGGRECVRFLKSCYSISRAFWNYQKKEYSEVPLDILRSIKNNPALLTNRGLPIILARSIVGMTKSLYLPSQTC